MNDEKTIEKVGESHHGLCAPLRRLIGIRRFRYIFPTLLVPSLILGCKPDVNTCSFIGAKRQVVLSRECLSDLGDILRKTSKDEPFFVLTLSDDKNFYIQGQLRTRFLLESVGPKFAEVNVSLRQRLNSLGWKLGEDGNFEKTLTIDQSMPDLFVDAMLSAADVYSAKIGDKVTLETGR